MYRIYYDLPYEGIQLEKANSLGEIQEWLKKTNYRINTDYIEIIKVEKVYNPYDILKGYFNE